MTPAIDILALSYPDFVAVIGQENSPPGGSASVSQWREWASSSGSLSPDEGSHAVRILDLACSTGYSGREFTRNLNSSYQVTGIDISERAVQAARTKAGGDSRYSYLTADASSLPFDSGSFDIVLAGCNFAFIGEREHAASEVWRVLRGGGSLYVANFYYQTEPTVSILDRVEAAIGFRPSQEWNAAFWNRLFERRFALKAEQVSDLAPLSRRSIATSALLSAALSDSPQKLSLRQRVSTARRLYRTRKVLSEHRAYQGLSVQAWRKANDESDR